MFFSPFSITITSLWEKRVYFSAFRMFVRVALVCFCLFPLPIGVWEGLRLEIVALPGLFSYFGFLDAAGMNSFMGLDQVVNSCLSVYNNIVVFSSWLSLETDYFS